jgi:hypothetical protein
VPWGGGGAGVRGGWRAAPAGTSAGVRAAPSEPAARVARVGRVGAGAPCRRHPAQRTEPRTRAPAVQRSNGSVPHHCQQLRGHRTSVRSGSTAAAGGARRRKRARTRSAWAAHNTRAAAQRSACATGAARGAAAAPRRRAAPAAAAAGGRGGGRPRDKAHVHAWLRSSATRAPAWRASAAHHGCKAAARRGRARARRTRARTGGGARRVVGVCTCLYTLHSGPFVYRRRVRRV